jgi:uncharacterized protein
VDLAPPTIGLLFLAGLFAGLVDSVAGGGGLITVPVLLGLGLPPAVALGTNKLQASFGSFTAARTHHAGGAIDWREARFGVLMTLLGAAAGTATVQLLDPLVLARLIPFLLLVIFLFTLFSPRVGMEEAGERMGRRAFYAVFGLALGFYDGFLGPGTGTFWALAFVLARGFSLGRATAYTKVMNFASNAVSLLVFAVGGQVMWLLALPMAAGQALGARAGSLLVIRRGARLVRPVFIVVVFATMAKLFWTTWVTG